MREFSHVNLQSGSYLLRTASLPDYTSQVYDDRLRFVPDGSTHEAVHSPINSNLISLMKALLVIE